MLPLLFLFFQSTIPHGQTPLHAAVLAQARGMEMLRSLLAKGADPNARDDSGASPLDYAVWEGSLDASLLLIDAGAEINAPETKTGATPVNEAAFKGHFDLVQLLVAHGADISIKDHAGFSPIQNALRHHQPEIVRYLLSVKRSPEIRRGCWRKRFAATSQTWCRCSSTRAST